MLVTPSCLHMGQQKLLCMCVWWGALSCLWDKQEPSSEQRPSHSLSLFLLIEIFIEIVVDAHVVKRKKM